MTRPTQPIALKPKSSIRGVRARATRLARNHLWFWIIASIALVVITWLVGDALVPFIVALTIAYFLNPTVEWLERRGLPRGIAAGLAVTVFFGLLTGAITTVVPTLWDQIGRLIQALPDMAARAVELAQRMNDHIRPPPWIPVLRPVPVAPAAAPTVSENIQTLAPLAGQAVSGVVGGGLILAHFIFVLLLMPLIAFYLLRDWHRILDFIDDQLPRRYAPMIRREAREVDRVLGGFVRGQTVMCAVLAAYYSITLSLLGLEFGLIIGTVTGLLSFIPYVGTFTGLATALIAVSMQYGSDATMLAGVGAIFVGAQVLEIGVLIPMLVGPHVRLHPAWLIFGLLVGGALFGWIGVFLAVPLFAVVGVGARFAMRWYRASDYYSGANAEVVVPVETPNA